MAWGRSPNFAAPYELLGAQWLHERGINTPLHLEQAAAAVVPTFDSALAKWKDARLVGFKPSGKSSSEYVVNKHIAPHFKDMLLEQVDKQAVQVWANNLSASGLAPKNGEQHRQAAKIHLELERHRYEGLEAPHARDS